MIEAGATIVGVVKGASLASDKVTPLVAFILSLGLGVVFGLFHLFGLDVQTGIVTALASTGTYQIAKKIGGQ